MPASRVPSCRVAIAAAATLLPIAGADVAVDPETAADCVVTGVPGSEGTDVPEAIVGGPAIGVARGVGLGGGVAGTAGSIGPGGAQAIAQAVSTPLTNTQARRRIDPFPLGTGHEHTPATARLQRHTSTRLDRLCAGDGIRPRSTWMPRRRPASRM